MSLFLNFMFGIVVLTVFVEGHDKVVVCYYGTWATYRSGDGKFDVSHIDTSLCTHLVYAFVGIQTDGTVVSLDKGLDLPDNNGLDNFNKFNALKQQNSKLKTILAVGGWNEGSAKYSTMVASASLRKTFITSARDMILNYGFDGLDIDWEYPNQRDSTNGAADVSNFPLLLKELRAEFDDHGLLVTVAVAAEKGSASLSYDIPSMTHGFPENTVTERSFPAETALKFTALSWCFVKNHLVTFIFNNRGSNKYLVLIRYVDMVSIMAYDMYGAWDPVTGHNAPLHKGEGDENASKDSIYSVDMALEYWLAQGCPPEKLVLGLPIYGRTFTLMNPDVNGVRAPASGAGLAGPYTSTNGLIGYNEFCSTLQTETWDIRYDSLAEVPYAVQGRNWVSYDDPNSLAKKVEYAKNLGIAGAMVWSIETDDFHGKCGEAFALLKAIKRSLDGSTSEPPSSGTTVSTTSGTSSSTTVSTTKAASTTTSTTKVPSSSTTITSTTTIKTSTPTGSTPSQSVCTKEGSIANPDDYSTFFVCIIGADGNLDAKLFSCPSSLIWDDTNKLCNYK